MHLTSRILAEVPGVIHGFGTRLEPIPANLEELWASARPQWRQVHGTAQAEVQNVGQNCGEVDALFTFRTGLPLAVVTADCVPILMARRKGGAVAAIHAGWRGTRAHILGETWKTLISRGETPKDWVAAVGPAIGPCCYQVSQDLAEDFLAEFVAKGGDPLRVVPKPRMLDLPYICSSELQSIGIGEVDLIRNCTQCSGPEGQRLFHSYRRAGGGTRQYSMILAT